MSRQQRQQIRVEKLAEIVDFRFLQLHATKVPNGWDKLVISVISVETGKAIVRTNKAAVRSGNCKWLEDVSESVRFLQDDNSRELEEKLYKFVVSMGSARLGILGEATVNLADYLNSKELVWIKMPLKKCIHGTILHVKIQCLTPRTGSRESELRSKTVEEQVEQIAVFDEADDGSEGSIRSARSLFLSQSNSTLQQMESKSKDSDSFTGTSRRGLDSLELSAIDSAVNGNSKGFAYGDQASSPSIKNGFYRRQHSTGPQDGIAKYRAGNGIDQFGAILFGGKDSGTVEYPRNQSFDRATTGSHGSIQDGLQNVYKGSPLGGLASGSGASNDFLEAAEVSIQELQKESMMWERKAQNLILETETLKQQLAKQKRQHKEMEMQFLTMQTERDSFKQEVEQLKSSLQDYIESEKGADNAKFEAQDAKRMVKEFEDEIKLQKESNVNLSLQFSKIQEANTELVFALQDLEETIERQNVEIEKLLEARGKDHDADVSEQEAEEMRQYAELGAKFSDVVAERDKHVVPEMQEDIKMKELGKKLSLNVQNAQVLSLQFSPTAHEIDEMLIDKGNETNENLSNAEWMQKLSYQKEEIRTLKEKISSFASKNSLTEVTELIDESQQDLHQYLETLKRDMNELEKDCKELTDENLELIYSLNKLNKNLESKNVYIAELEGKLRVSSFGSTLPGEQYIDIRTSSATYGVDELNAQVNDLEKKLDFSKPLYNTELTGMEMSLSDSQSQVMKAQNDNSSLENKLNTFEERIHELENELKSAHKESTKMEKILEPSHGHQFDAHDSRATKSKQEIAGAIQKVQTLKLKNINDTIFIDELKVLVTQLNEKVETSEHLHSLELTNMKRSLNEYKSQVLELESQKLEVECNYQSQVLELESQKLELECVTIQQETIEREINLTVNYESRLEDNEARVTQAVKEVANALQLVQTLEEDKCNHSIVTKGLNDHLTDLEQKLNWTADSYRAEIATKEKLLGGFQHQVKDLQNQNHGLQGDLRVLKQRIHDLEHEVETAEREIVKREDVTAAYEYKLQSVEVRAIRAEVDLAHSHERVKSCESSTAKDAIMIDSLKVQVTQLQQEIKSFQDSQNMQLSDQEKSFSNFCNQVMKLQSENTVLENKESMLNEKICELENEAQKAQQEAIDTEKEISQKEKLVSDFQHQVMDLQNQNNGLQGELNVLKEKICDLESAVQTAEREMGKREEVTAAYENKLQRTEEQAIRAETDLADSLERVKYFESSTAKDAVLISSLKGQVVQLKQELKSSEDVNSTQLTDLEISLSDFLNQVMNLQSENAIFANKVSILKEIICELENEAHKAQQEAIEREQEIPNKEKLLSDYQHQVIDLQNQNHGLQGELNVFKERICNLEREVQTAEVEIVKREKEVRAAYEYNLQRTDARAIRAEADLADSLERVKSFEISTAKDVFIIDSLKLQVVQLQKELKSSEDLYSVQFAGLEKSLSVFQNQVKKLQSENTTLENKVSMMNEKIREMENEAQQEAIDNEGEIANKENLLSDFQHQVTDLHNQNHGLQGELNVMKERIFDLESEFQAAEREIIEKGVVTAIYEYNLQKTEGRAIRAEVDLADSLERIKSFESSTGNYVIMIDGLRVQIVQLQQELKSSEDVNSMQLAGMEKSFNEFRNQVMNLQSENTVLENTVSMLEENICELENEVQRARQEAIDNEKDLSAAYECRLQANEARAKLAEEEITKALKSVVKSDNAEHKIGEIISEQQNQIKAFEDQTAKIQDELTDALKTIRDLQSDKETISLELSNECTTRQNAENAISSLDHLNEDLKIRIQNIETKHLENCLQLSRLEETNLQQQKQLDSYSLIEKNLHENINLLEIVKMKLHSEIEKLQKEGSSSKSCIQDLNCQLSALMVELQSLKCSNQNLDIRATKLQMENVDLEEKLDAAQKESKSSRDRLEDLGRLLEPLRANAESNSLAKTNLDKRAMELQHSKEETESCLKETMEKNVHLLKQVHSLEMILNNTAEERDFFRLDLDNAKASCFNLQAEMKTLELELREENVKLLQVLRESQRKLSGTLEEVESGKREQQLLELTLENLKKEHTAAMDLNSELEEKCFNLFESQSNLEQRLQEVTGDIFVSFNQIKSLKSDLSILQLNMTGKKGIWAPNTEAYQLATRRHEETGIKADEAIGQEYSENENAVESLQMEVQSLSRQVYLVLEEKERILTEALIQASDLCGEKMNLEDSLQLNQENVKQIEAELLHVKQEYESEVQELKLEVNVARKKEEDLHFKLGHMHRKLEDAKVREADLQERVHEIKIQVVAIEYEKKKLKGENISLSSQVDQLMGLKAETDALQSIVEHTRDEKNALQQSLHSTEDELGRLKAENVLLMEKLAATNQGLVEVYELKQRNAELEEKILCLQAEMNSKEVKPKNKSVQFPSLSDQFQWKLQYLEEEKENNISEANLLENEMQLKVNAISKAKVICTDKSDCKVGNTSPPQDTDQSTKLSDRIGALESELETRIKEFEEKEETLIAEIQNLEEMNHQLMQAKVDSDTDQLQIELIRLQKQNSTLLQKQHELLSKLGAQELFQKEVYRLLEVNKQLETRLTRYRETANGGNIIERVVAMETELAEALEANSMYQIQLQSILQQKQNVQMAALHSFGPIDQIINELVSYKREISTLEAELNDLRVRYSSLSLKLAEVEVQREELVMTIKHAKYGKMWNGKT